MIEQTCSEIAKTALNRQYIFGLIVGYLSFLITCGLINLPEFFGRRKIMLSKMQHLINYNDGIVTAVDLVVAAQVSPEKATKFLASFARKLEVAPEVEEETGTIFYRFNDAKQVAKRLDSIKLKSG